MRIEFYSAEKLKKQILAIVSKRLDLAKYKIFFFGSRVEGKGDERSDIDIGIEGERPIPPRVLFEIEDEIDALPTLYKIELVDFRRVAQKFKDVATGHIEIINEQHSISI